MKKNYSILLLLLISLLLLTNCKKEKIIYQYIESEKGSIYLLGMRTLFVNDTTARLVIDYIDLDSATTTQYNNTLFNIETAQQEASTTTTNKKAVYDNVRLQDYYRHTTASTPNNDTLRVTFRIGTQGDIYISNDR